MYLCARHLSKPAKRLASLSTGSASPPPISTLDTPLFLAHATRAAASATAVDAIAVAVAVARHSWPPSTPREAAVPRAKGASTSSTHGRSHRQCTRALPGGFRAVGRPTRGASASLPLQPTMSASSPAMDASPAPAASPAPPKSPAPNATSPLLPLPNDARPALEETRRPSTIQFLAHRNASLPRGTPRPRERRRLSSPPPPP